MKPKNTPVQQNSFYISRREFIGNCAICAAGITALSALPLSPLLAAIDTLKMEKTKIRLIFAHPDPTKPNWPNIDYDFSGHIKEVHKKLQQDCPQIEFFAVTVTSGSKDSFCLIFVCTTALFPVLPVDVERATLFDSTFTS